MWDLNLFFPPCLAPPAAIQHFHSEAKWLASQYELHPVHRAWEQGRWVMLRCRQHCTTPRIHMFPWDSGRNTLPVIAVLLLSVGKDTHHLTSATQATSLLHDLAPCLDPLKCLLTVTCAGGRMAWGVAYGQVCSGRNIFSLLTRYILASPLATKPR